MVLARGLRGAESIGDARIGKDDPLALLRARESRELETPPSLAVL
jgi:hypothetical protein